MPLPQTLFHLGTANHETAHHSDRSCCIWTLPQPTYSPHPRRLTLSPRCAVESEDECPSSLSAEIMIILEGRLGRRVAGMGRSALERLGPDLAGPVPQSFCSHTQPAAAQAPTGLTGEGMSLIMECPPPPGREWREEVKLHFEKLSQKGPVCTA